MLTNDRDFLFSSPVVVKQMKTYLQERGLSKRESEVVILVVQGLTNKQVADRLCVAEKTVKFHLTNVYKRMKISRRSQIIWTLPMAQFIEHAKDTEPSPPSGGTGGGGRITTGGPAESPIDMDDTAIPVGHSTVTDNL